VIAGIRWIGCPKFQEDLFVVAGNGQVPHRKDKMSAITLNKEAGLATDFGELWHEDAEDPIRVVVDFSLEDDDQISISWSEDSHTVTLYLPEERLKKLLKGR
jgi:hypothetical protein